MPGTNSNTVLYATRGVRYVITKIASGTTSATQTDVIDAAATYGTVVTDVLFRSKDASARNFDIYVCTTGGAGSANPVVQIQVPAGSGNNGSTAIASLASLAPQLFDVDLAGNRVIGIDTGISIYVQLTATSAGDIIVTVKARDYTP